MTARNQDERELQRVSSLLGLVERHPAVGAWLREIEEGQRPPRRTIRRWTAVAASLLIATGAAVAAYRYWSPVYYETRVGEQRDVTLADGSHVTLNTNTVLAVRYSRARRLLRLERGEALFTVRRDAARPFEVVANGMVTRALGTEFNVDLRKSKVTVSVLEGAVQVTPQPASSIGHAATKESHTGRVAVLAPTALSKGEAVEFRPESREIRAEKADLRRIEAWRTRRVEFSDTPLGEAVAEFNRYSTKPVVIGSPDLESVRISGVFRIAGIDGFLYSLRHALDIETHDSGDAIVLLHASPPIDGQTSTAQDTL